MTKQEFAPISIIIKETYPSTKILDSQQSIEIWYDFLSDLDYKVFKEIVRTYISTERFAPTIADLRKAYAIATGSNFTKCGFYYPEWLKVLQNQFNDLNEPAKYAFSVIGGKRYIEYCNGSSFKELDFARKEFAQIYKDYVSLVVVKKQSTKITETRTISLDDLQQKA